MALCTFNDIPDTVLADIFACFDLNANWFYRRVSGRWLRLLVKLFATSDLCVSIPKLQGRFSFNSLQEASLCCDTLKSIVKEWFAAQENARCLRNIFFYGRGEPRFQIGLPNSLVDILQLKMKDMKRSPRWWMWAYLRLTAEDLLYMRVEHCIADPCFIPPSCRLLLKNCHVDGFDWVNMECGYLRSTLFSVFVTEIEVVNFGDMDKGHMRHNDKSYTFGDGEEDAFTAELLRLGRKYAKPMSDSERQVFHHFLYYYMGPGLAHSFCLTVDSIIRRHEPSPKYQALLPRALGSLAIQWETLTLNPLTERLLEGLARHYFCDPWPTG